MVRCGAHVGLGLALVAISACAANPGPGQAGYAFNLDGRYTGRVFFAGDPFDATIELDTVRGGAVSGTFEVRSPVLIDGRVEGVVLDDLFRVRVLYQSPGGCDGSMEGVLSIAEGGDTFEGPVTVRDCGEPIAGRLAFERATRSDTPEPWSAEVAPCP